MTDPYYNFEHDTTARRSRLRLSKDFRKPRTPRERSARKLTVYNASKPQDQPWRKHVVNQTGPNPTHKPESLEPMPQEVHPKRGLKTRKHPKFCSLCPEAPARAELRTTALGPPTKATTVFRRFLIKNIY